MCPLDSEDVYGELLFVSCELNYALEFLFGIGKLDVKTYTLYTNEFYFSGFGNISIIILVLSAVEHRCFFFFSLVSVV